MRDTPVRLLTRVMGLVAPLHLLDPKSRDFCEASCATIHDVLRLCKSGRIEMFRIATWPRDRPGWPCALRP
jgi:hypothetical protein